MLLPVLGGCAWLLSPRTGSWHAAGSEVLSEAGLLLGKV